MIKGKNSTTVPEDNLFFSYSVSPENIERDKRQSKRAEELGIDLYVLDGDDNESELQLLEDDIVYNYILMDLDVPEELKTKYLKLKNEAAADKSVVKTAGIE